MPDQKDAKEVTRGTVKQARRFDARDFDFMAEYVVDEWSRRKTARKMRELHWKEIDRQLEMTPDVEFKYIIKEGVRLLDVNKAWMAEMELPLQAQALEVLTADARRLRSADGKAWFRAHAEVTDEYLERVDFSSFILGDENDVPSQITQDNADKLVEGFQLFNFRQTDFDTRMDRIDAEAFKYGMGVGRARMDTKNIYIHEAKGVKKEKQKLPVIIPTSIKNTYLDDRPPSAHSAQVLGDAHIFEDRIKIQNLAMAANKGNKDPNDPDGGWMPAQLKKIEPDDDDFVTLVEMEGDIVVPRKTVRSVVIPGAIITVAVGVEGKQGVVRFRYRKDPFSSYILFPYHYEHIDNPYPSSPLMKGRPVQIMATDALNRLMDSSALKNGPPVGYDPTSLAFTQSGGPRIQPNALWETIDEIKVYTDVGGEPAALASIFSQAVNLYAELTGILPARLGAQTVSHTTAFAKDAELQRGAVRTVDYVNQSGHGPLTRWLDMSYKMGRDALGSRETIAFFIESYGGFVEISKSQLPDRSSFEWFGSGGPQDEAAKTQARLQALQLAISMDQLAISLGEQPTVDVGAAIREVLREGKWTDVDAITSVKEPGGGPAAASGISGVGPDDAANPSAALQALAFGGQ